MPARLSKSVGDRCKRFALTLAAAVMLAVAAVGCGSSAHRQSTGASARQASSPPGTQPTTQPGSASMPTGPSIGGCNYAVPHAHLVRFRASREQLRAAVSGRGPIGVVLANQTDNNACQWLPFPGFLAAHGMRVLAFDYYGGGDASAEVQAAARFLRERGVRRLVLIGASMGGAVVIDAGLRLRPEPTAVVSLSAVPEATLYPFPADARRLRSPIFQIGATEDQLIQYGQTTRSLFQASPSSAKRLLLIPSAEHGVDFVDATAGNRVRDAILAFIKAHTS